MASIMKSWMVAMMSLLMLLGATACRQASMDSDAAAAKTDSVITHARLLTLERKPLYTLAIVGDPWKQGSVLHRYVLVPDSIELPGQLPEGTVVRTPIKRALVYSAVHTALMKELGAFDALKGVTDLQYFTDPDVPARVAAGEVTDCGSSMGPTVEKVIEMEADAIMLSPYQDATYGQVTRLGIPVIECADYMESTPLGRAEWVKFYGELLGRRAQADSLFNAVETAYARVKEQAAAGTAHPTVLTEMVISGVWNVPGGESYMARIIGDAGGKYPWANDHSTGSLNLDFNQVLATAQQADVWLIKSFNIHSYNDLRAAYALNEKFAAFENHRVYVCDTNRSRLFERFPFHPDVLLQEYANIFAGRDGELQFFEHMKQ